MCLFPSSILTLQTSDFGFFIKPSVLFNSIVMSNKSSSLVKNWGRYYLLKFLKTPKSYLTFPSSISFYSPSWFTNPSWKCKSSSNESIPINHDQFHTLQSENLEYETLKPNHKSHLKLETGTLPSQTGLNYCWWTEMGKICSSPPCSRDVSTIKLILDQFKFNKIIIIIIKFH